MPSKNYHHGNLKNALIEAGVNILAQEGLSGLSLRMVAKEAGVSHAAPYAHFADKQALIAAISTEGFKQLYIQIAAALAAHLDEPQVLLVETAWAYLQFAAHNPDRFKLMFSSVLEKEKNYPDFVEASQQNFQQLVQIVEICQRAGVLEPGPADLTAVSIWSTVHGFVSLLLEGQIPHAILGKAPVKDLLVSILQE